MSDYELDREAEDRLSDTIAEAEKAFWGVVARRYPKVTAGDFPFDAAFKFDDACEAAVRLWLSFNVGVEA